ncbi:g5548 [Coccomyxa elongata]
MAHHGHKPLEIQALQGGDISGTGSSRDRVRVTLGVLKGVLSESASQSRGVTDQFVVNLANRLDPMPRVKLPRAGRALKVLWQGPVSNPHAPAKTIAVRKFTTTHGTLAQQKVSGSTSQLQDCRKRSSPVSSSTARAFTTNRIPTFAAAPYLKLINRQLRVDSALEAPVLPSPTLPSPSFAARPVWENRKSLPSTDDSPQARRQAAVRARLARTPLYAYSQLEASRGVQKRSAHAASAAAAKSGKVSAKENEALKWYGTLDGSKRAKSGRSLSVAQLGKPRAARKSL